MSDDIFLLLQNGNKRNVVLEQSTAGSGTVTIAKSGSYFLELVGGGSGVAGFTDMPTGVTTTYWTGSNGGCFLGIVTLQTGTYSYTVGAAGSDNIVYVEVIENVSQTLTGGTGGDSIFVVDSTNYILSATGATGPTVIGTKSSGSIQGSTEGENGTVICKNSSNVTTTIPSNCYIRNTDDNNTGGYFLGHGHKSLSNETGAGSGYIRLTYIE